MSIEPCFLTATEASKLIRSDKLTVEELAKSYLNRINERDEDVKAWVFLDPDLVLANARALDKVPKAERGPMHGIPIGVKDVIHTLGTWLEVFNRSVLRADMQLTSRHAYYARIRDLQGRLSQNRCR